MKKICFAALALLLVVGLVFESSVALAAVHGHGGYRRFNSVGCSICSNENVTATYSCSNENASPNYSNSMACSILSSCSYRIAYKKTCYDVSDGCHSHGKFKNYHAHEHIVTSHNKGCAYN